MDDQLRLGASFQDGASPAIRKLKKTIEEVRTTPAMQDLHAWFGKAAESAESFATKGGGAAGVINSLGVGSLTAAASMAGLVAHFKSVGESALQLKELARQTGVSTDYLNAFIHAGRVFGAQTSTMERAIQGLAGQMPQFMHGFGDLHNLLANNWPDLAEKLKTEDTAHQIEDILKQLDKVKDPQLQRQLFGDIFKTEDLETIMPKGMKAFIDELHKQMEKLPHIGSDVFTQAQAFRESVIGFDDAMDRFTQKAAPGFLDAMTKLVNLATKAAEVLSHPKDLLPHAPTDDDNKKMREGQKQFDDSNWNPLNWFRSRHKTAFSGPASGTGVAASGGGMLHLASFGGLSSYGDAGTIADGTKAGFLAAMRELMSMPAGADAAGGGEKPILASLGGQASGGVGPGGSGPSGHGGRGNLGDPTGAGGPSFKGKAPVGNWWNAEHVGHAVDRLMKEAGLSRAGAEGLVSRWAAVEAAQGPLSRNKSSGALGIGQWLGSRKKGFTADFDSQLGHAIDELRTSESRAARQLRKAQTARDAAVGASMFERAEGYNPRSGVDNFTSKSEAAAGRIHALGRPGVPAAHLPGVPASHPPVYGEHRGAPVPIPYIQPLPGDPPRRAEGLADRPGAGSTSPSTQNRLHIEIDHHPESRVRIRQQSPDVTTTMRRRWPRNSDIVDA